MKNNQGTNKIIQLIPQTMEGIRKFLMSVNGIGIKTIDLILDKYLLKSWCIIIDNTNLLSEIKGIGPTKQNAIRKAVHQLIGYEEKILKFD